MAIDQGTETIEIATEERTWRINIETPKGGEAMITVYRETVKTGPAGEIILKQPSADVRRRLSDIATQSYTVGGNVYTTAEIAGVIAAIADIWREEDLAAAAAE